MTGEIERQEGLTEEHRPALVRGTILALGRGCLANDLRQWGWTAYRDLAFTYCPAGRAPGRENQAYINLEDGDLYRFGLESGG